MEGSRPNLYIKVNSSKCILKSELLSLLKTYNCYHEGKSFQLRHREEEGELIIEGLLNISWGLRRPIRLQMQDDNERVCLPSSEQWKTEQSGLNSRHHLPYISANDGQVFESCHKRTAHLVSSTSYSLSFPPLHLSQTDASKDHRGRSIPEPSWEQPTQPTHSCCIRPNMCTIRWSQKNTEELKTAPDPYKGSEISSELFFCGSICWQGGITTLDWSGMDNKE